MPLNEAFMVGANRLLDYPTGSQWIATYFCFIRPCTTKI